MVKTSKIINKSYMCQKVQLKNILKKHFAILKKFIIFIYKGMNLSEDE